MFADSFPPPASRSDRLDDMGIQESEAPLASDHWGTIKAAPAGATNTEPRPNPTVLHPPEGRASLSISMPRDSSHIYFHPGRPIFKGSHQYSPRTASPLGSFAPYVTRDIRDVHVGGAAK